MASKVYSSPGVYMTEKDLTFSVETVGVTTLGLVGETKKGPAFQPFFVKSYDEFKTFFGGTSPEKFKGTQIPKYELPYIAKSYLTQSNQLFVTRVLGLSGYNAGSAWAIKTMGAPDINQLNINVATSGTTVLTADLDGNGVVTVNGEPILNAVATYVGVTSQLIEANINSFFAVNGSYKTETNVGYWGPIDTLIGGGNTGVNLYSLPTGYTAGQLAEHWLIKTFVYDEITEKYNGVAFTIYAHEETATTYSVNITKYVYTIDPIADMHNKTVALLRSKATYIGNDLYASVDSGDLTLEGDIATNPLADFDIIGTNANSEEFTYNVSLDPANKNFIKNVLGKANGERTTDLWVEENYENVLLKAVANGTVIGLYATAGYTSNYSNYNYAFQSPSTPYFVSELRGGIALPLFKFISISDGADANTDVKISIVNVDIAKKTFDVLVRVFSDDDKKPSILERYPNCNMNHDDDNYIGRRIGTADNEFDLVSKYVLVEIADNAPSDAIPAGFEGYGFKFDAPAMPYKTKYYTPGETISQAILSNPIIAAGDKVKKTYLGFATVTNVDTDLLKFNGGQTTGYEWSYVSKGFHMDVNADATLFEVGEGSFIDATIVDVVKDHPYYDIKTRKFTALLSGGFDGWDIFQETKKEGRSNGDTYKIGGPGFVGRGFTSNNYFSEYDEYFGNSDYYAFLNGIKTFNNPETVTINIFATPGLDIINNTELVRDTIEMIEENRQDSIYIATLPDINLISNTTPSDVDSWIYPNEIIGKLEDTQIDSNYTAVYYPWIQILDTENNTNLFVSPTSEVIRNLALTDNVAHPWYATAGYSRGLVNSKRTRIKLDQEQRDVLYEARINPIATDPSVGTVIWGNRNLQELDSALNRINVRRLLLQAKKLIQAVSKRLLFDPNDERVRSEFLSLVNPILDNIRKERGLYDFRVVVSSDAADLDANTLRGKIYLKPTRTLEFIELEFNVTPTSVSFDAIS